ncbi:MAG TPA: HAD family hydrolase [Candidatus Limnocylindria bacterium]|jgi:FMN phosphatase YigB (HAD superfamily)|nr:HAD family hydrolase [Candidatus Limnocylindria bacterium]
MAKISTLFVDKGGVLVNNDELGAQYQRLIAEYLPTVLGGGGARSWGDANVWAFDRQWARWEAATRVTSGGNIREWFEADAANWLYDMCEMVRLPRPPVHDAKRIANDTLRYVRERVGIKVPAIIGRLRELRERGLILHVASGDAHEDLTEYLRAIDARDLFDRVYGSDLLKVWKSSAAYYRAILAETGIDPATALVVDDSERAIGWAAECGLRGVLVRRAEGEGFEAAVLRAFDDVEAILA